MMIHTALAKLHECVECHTHQPLERVATRIRELLTRVDPSAIGDTDMSSQDIAVLNRAKMINDDYMMTAEATVAKQVIASGQCLDDEDSSPMRRDLAARLKARDSEMCLDLLGSGRVTCVVGAGAWPDGMMHLFACVERAPRSVTGLDIDVTAASLGRQTLQATGLGDRTTIVVQRGQDYDYAECDSVYIEGFVRPKQAVVDQVRATARPGTVIAIDRPLGLFKHIYDDVLTDQMSAWAQLIKTMPLDETTSTRESRKMYRNQIEYWALM